MLDLDKEYYVVDCWDFVYFPRIVHIIGIGGSSANSEIEYTLDMIDNYSNDYRTMYKDQLTRFETFDKCKEYAEYLNNIPENKKRAESWNTKDKFIIEFFRKGSGVNE